jgi:hypothetical protein
VSPDGDFDSDPIPFEIALVGLLTLGEPLDAEALSKVHCVRFGRVARQRSGLDLVDCLWHPAMFDLDDLLGVPKWVPGTSYEPVPDKFFELLAELERKDRKDDGRSTCG